MILSITFADDYTVDSNHKSLVVAVGCFWCGEESFERYGPGVVEAVSGYAGGTNQNPTYGNHPGHYEVVLVEYDPKKTSYSTLLRYAWRNLDPFDGDGQFCDQGTSYRPAVFYANEEEKMEAEIVYEEVSEENPTWDESLLLVPILERPTFWKAEDYHQNYYIKKPGNYGYYKKACGRERRLKYVWGEDVYKCYHDLNTTCFNGTVTNEDGTIVEAVVNRKGTSDIKAALLPTKAWVSIVVCVVILSLIVGFCIFTCRRKSSSKSNNTNNKEETSLEDTTSQEEKPEASTNA